MTPVDVVRAYLTVFQTGAVTRLDELVAEDVEIWGANHHVRGRARVAASVHTPGLSNCRTEIIELFEAGDRVVVYFRNTYTHDASGRDVEQTGMKMYQVEGGQIVRFWGETDLWGLLRQVGKVPDRVDFE